MTKARSIPFVDPGAPLFVHAAVAIGTRLDDLITFEECLADPDRVVELHNMRIAAKRLRYTMDLFSQAFNEYTGFGKQFGEFTSKVKLLQEFLGDIHDADVQAPRLAERLSRTLAPGFGKRNRIGVHLVDFEACEGLLTMCREAASSRDKAYAALNSAWAEMRAADAFDALRKLLRDAVTEETLRTVLHEPIPDLASEQSVVTPSPRKRRSSSSGSGSAPGKATDE